MKIAKLGFLTFFVMIMVGCSGETKAPTCDVFVENNQINVVVKLPAEEMDYHDKHDLEVPGVSGTPSKVSISGGGSSVNYSQTGNSYYIEYSVDYENGEITHYLITIEGDVYGDTVYTCEK
jgi:hypothetical protein